MPATYLRMIPEEGLQLGNFTFKESIDIDAAKKDELVNNTTILKQNDNDYQTALIEINKFPQYTTYTKETVTHIFGFLSDEPILEAFFARINPSWAGLDGPKDFLMGAAPLADKWYYSKEYMVCLFRLAHWLFANDKIDCVYGRIMELQIDGQWASNSMWCDSRQTDNFVTEKIILQDNLIVNGKPARMIARIVRKVNNILVGNIEDIIAALPDKQSPWRNKRGARHN